MKLMKTTIGMVIVTLISILLGFARESVTVYKLGASWQADSFIFSVAFPGFIFATLGGVISTTFVPLYTDLIINKTKKEANDFANIFINIIVLISLILVIIGEIYTGQIIRILAPGFKGETYEFTLKLVRIILPSMIFMGMIYCFVGILTSFKELIITSAISIPLHLSIIFALIFIYPSKGLEYSIAMVLFGSLLQVAMFIPKLIKNGYRYTFNFNFKNHYIKEAIYMIGPMAIGIMVQQINIMIDKSLASTLDQGGITSINLASKLNIATYSSIGYLLVVLIFPILSQYASENNMEKFSKTLVSSLNVVIGLMISITIISIFFRRELVNILFGYGKFTEKDVTYTSQILLFYSLEICFLGIRDVLNRAFYSLKDTKTSMKNGIIGVVINIILSLLLIRVMDAKGLALSTSISMIIISILLFKDIKSKLVDVNLTKFYLNISKILIAGIVQYGVMIAINKFFTFISWNKSSKIYMLIYISIVSIISASIYIVLLYILKVDGIEDVKNKIKNKIKKAN
ncbi:murein biosynthesis integral membrane protein MurJ [Clostridium botulinum]|nr:murein biosynthesis integral membrane protein MurJ [Clostridium botulinum]